MEKKSVLTGGELIQGDDTNQSGKKIYVKIGCIG